MTTPIPMNKTDLFVVVRILERLWREGDPMVKTRLQAAANLNYDVFTRYIGWMLDRGLLKEVVSDEGHERIALTPKGVVAYQRLVQWIHEFVREVKP